jgi:hypothetical protein
MLIEDFQNIISKTTELYNSGIRFDDAFFTARHDCLKETYNKYNIDSIEYESIAHEIYLFVINELYKKFNGKFYSMLAFSKNASKKQILDFLYYLQKLSKLIVFK